MARKTHQVVPSISGWKVVIGGAKRASGQFSYKQVAVSKAKEISRDQNSELIFHNRDGKISRADSQGK